MADRPFQLTLSDALARLRIRYGALLWTVRRDLVAEVAVCLSGGRQSDVVLPLLRLLADDPKWEVRKEIADILLLVPDEDFPAIATKLSEDSNTFVRRAAERSMARRRRSPGEDDKRRRGMEQIHAQYTALEKRYGREAADKALEMGERFYDVLVGATVHDVRGILTPLKARVERLIKGLDNGEIDLDAFRTSLTKMGERLGFLERLMNDMSEYSQAQTGRRTRERLADIVQEARAMVTDDLQTNGLDVSPVTLTVDIPDTATVRAARHQIMVAIANVLKNAYEALIQEDGTLEEGEITVQAKVAAGELMVVVSDTGMGMDAEDLTAVREFVPGRTSKKNRGTGFGLPIAKRRIEAHGGTISIDSTLDAGTTVRITLPLPQDLDE